jgi:hypothetical protein
VVSSVCFLERGLIEKIVTTARTDFLRRLCMSLVKGAGKASGHVKILWLRPLGTSSFTSAPLPPWTAHFYWKHSLRAPSKTNKLPITHAPGLLVIFTCLSETDFSSIQPEVHLRSYTATKNLKEVKNTSGLDPCAFRQIRLIMNEIRRNRRLIFARPSTEENPYCTNLEDSSKPLMPGYIAA